MQPFFLSTVLIRLINKQQGIVPQHCGARRLIDTGFHQIHWYCYVCACALLLLLVLALQSHLLLVRLMKRAQ